MPHRAIITSINAAGARVTLLLAPGYRTLNSGAKAERDSIRYCPKQASERDHAWQAHPDPTAVMLWPYSFQVQYFV